MKPKFNKRKIVLRLFALPFVFGISAVFFAYLLILRCYNFILYGGELITYSERMDIHTIQQVFEEVQKQNKPSNQ